MKKLYFLILFLPLFLFFSPSTFAQSTCVDQSVSDCQSNPEYCYCLGCLQQPGCSFIHYNPGGWQCKSGTNICSGNAVEYVSTNCSTTTQCAAPTPAQPAPAPATQQPAPVTPSQTAVALTGTLTADPNPVIKKADGTYSQVALKVSANTGWKIYIYKEVCNNCSLTEGWTPIPSGSGSNNGIIVYQPPAYLKGTYTLALFDSNVSGIASKADVTFQEAATAPTTPTETKPSTVTMTGIQINDSDLDIKPTHNSLKLRLNVTNETKEQTIPVRVLVKYSDGTPAKNSVINFHYKPGGQPARLSRILIPDNLSLRPTDIKILELKYFPLEGNTNLLSSSITDIENTSLSAIQGHVDDLSKQALNALTKATSYHGYKTDNPSYLKFKIAESKQFLEPMPRSNFHAWGKPNIYRPDYNRMLTDNNICDLVDNQGVSQVWIWGYQYADIEPDESNMAMGKSSSQFWNHGSYGDISNSQQIDDLPVCNKTYTLFNYNYKGGLGGVLEDHGHHIERLLEFVNPSWWGAFQNKHGDLNGYNSCGWMHSPPNVTDEHQYDWQSETTVNSYCEDWKSEGEVSVKQINCHTWFGSTCQDNGGIEYKIWWMQNLPGYRNNLVYQNHPIRNWWEFYADFDAAITIDKSFYIDSVEVPPQSAQESHARISSFSGGNSIQAVDPSSVKDSIAGIIPASLPHPSPKTPVFSKSTQSSQPPTPTTPTSTTPTTFNNAKFIKAWSSGKYDPQFDCDRNSLINTVDYGMFIAGKCQ